MKDLLIKLMIAVINVDPTEAKLSINFTKTNTKFSTILHYSNDGKYLYMNKTKIYKFKGHDNISFP